MSPRKPSAKREPGAGKSAAKDASKNEAPRRVAKGPAGPKKAPVDANHVFLLTVLERVLQNKEATINWEDIASVSHKTANAERKKFSRLQTSIHKAMEENGTVKDNDEVKDNGESKESPDASVKAENE